MSNRDVDSLHVGQAVHFVEVITENPRLPTVRTAGVLVSLCEKYGHQYWTVKRCTDHGGQRGAGTQATIPAHRFTPRTF